jgi:hypothetical protein
MVGMKRAYDFFELVNCANILNHNATIEYGENGFEFGQFHNKMEIVRVDKLHPSFAIFNFFFGLKLCSES